MNKYLFSYAYNDSGFGIGRAIISLKNIDIEEIEFKLQSKLSFNKIILLNIVEISRKKNPKGRAMIKAIFQAFFPKAYMKLQFKRARQKEFDC